MEQMEFGDRDKARQNRDEGMERARKHANKKNTEWSGRALQCVQAYPHPEFLTEDVRKWSEETQGLPAPPDNRAWGSVICTARRIGMIVRLGYAKRTDPVAHTAIVTKWKKVS